MKSYDFALFALCSFTDSACLRGKCQAQIGHTPRGYEKNPVKILTGFFIAARQKRGEQGALAKKPGQSHDDDRPSRRTTELAAAEFGKPILFILEPGAIPEEGATE